MFSRNNTPSDPASSLFVGGPFFISLDGGLSTSFSTKESTGANSGIWMRLGDSKQVTVGWRYDYAALTDGILVVVE